MKTRKSVDHKEREHRQSQETGDWESVLYQCIAIGLPLPLPVRHSPYSSATHHTKHLHKHSHTHMPMPLYYTIPYASSLSLSLSLSLLRNTVSTLFTRFVLDSNLCYTATGSWGGSPYFLLHIDRYKVLCFLHLGLLFSSQFFILGLFLFCFDSFHFFSVLNSCCNCKDINFTPVGR